MWNGSLGTSRECETKSPKNVSRGRYHICTDINRSLDN